MTQITKDQHFVPRFYLKRFARDGKIQVFDVRDKQIRKPRPYASVCYEKFFYAAKTGVPDDVSQAIEDGFGQIENKIAGALPGIIDRAVAWQLTDRDLVILAVFMSVQWLRTPFFREMLQKAESDPMKQLSKKLVTFGYFRSMAKEHEMSTEELEEMEQFIRSGQYNIRSTNNALHLSFIKKEDITEFAHFLLAKKWRIFLSERPYYFITSDNPVAEWFPPRTGIFGASFMERQHYLALTPNILIETIRPDGIDPEQQPTERLSYHAASGKGILMFNILLASHAHQFAYAPQIGESDRILETVSKTGSRNR